MFIYLKGWLYTPVDLSQCSPETKTKNLAFRRNIWKK